jgi:hypothetical protein
MKITVDLPESDLRDICRITGITKKGPAIRQLVEAALQLEHRKEIAGKFVSGEWGTELTGFEAAKVADKAEAANHSTAWRD